MYGMPTLRFRLGRVPVEIELFHFLGAAMLGLNQAQGSKGLLWVLLWIAVVVASVLAHEVGHAIALARYRRPAAITLHGLGGVTAHPGGLTPKQNIVVHLAGPIPMLLLVGLPARYWYWHGHFNSEVVFRLAFDLYRVNFWWSIINLLPIWPLDGGQVFASITQLRHRNGNMPLVHWVSITVAIVGGGWALAVNQDNAYIFLFGLILAVQNFMKLKGSRVSFLHPGYEGSLAHGGGARSRPEPRADRGEGPGRRPRAEREPKPPKPTKVKPAERLARGFSLLARGDTDAARTEAEAVQSGRPSPEHRALAGEIIAWSFLQERNVPKARATLVEIGDRTYISKCLVAALEITGADEARGVQAVAIALIDEPEGPAKRQVIDYVGRRELGVQLAERLLSLPNGQGFEAAVRLAAVLGECGRREQANKVQELLFGG
jgi:Zn-dependent protease